MFLRLYCYCCSSILCSLVTDCECMRGKDGSGGREGEGQAGEISFLPSHFVVRALPFEEEGGTRCRRHRTRPPRLPLLFRCRRRSRRRGATRRPLSQRRGAARKAVGETAEAGKGRRPKTRKTDGRTERRTDHIASPSPSSRRVLWLLKRDREWERSEGR